VRRASPMLDADIELLNKIQPPSLLPHRVFRFAQEAERGMIRADEDVLSQKVLPKPL
jgi:hypothetical protein